MPKFLCSYAHDLPCYQDFVIEAKSERAAARVLNKALRDGKANLSDAYAYVSEAGEVWIKNLHISEFKFGTYANHAPLRERKLLLKKNELKKIRKELQNNGITLIPLKLYFSSRGWAKLDIALAKGKKFYDKRASIKERDIDRDAARE